MTTVMMVGIDRYLRVWRVLHLIIAVLRLRLLIAVLRLLIARIASTAFAYCGIAFAQYCSFNAVLLF